jgi:hypothetical protein
MHTPWGRLRLKCDGTSTDSRFFPTECIYFFTLTLSEPQFIYDAVNWLVFINQKKHFIWLWKLIFKYYLRHIEENSFAYLELGKSGDSVAYLILIFDHMLTAIGLTPGGSSKVHIYTQTIHRTTQLDCVWNVMAHAQKPDFVFRLKGRVYLNRRGSQFSRLLAGELCTSACKVCSARASLCSAVMWRLLVTHSVLLFALHFSSHATPCAITFQLDS